MNAIVQALAKKKTLLFSVHSRSFLKGLQTHFNVFSEVSEAKSRSLHCLVLVLLSAVMVLEFMSAYDPF